LTIAVIHPQILAPPLANASAHTKLDWAVDQLKGACIVLAKDQTGQCTALTSDLLLPGIFRQSVPHSSEKRKFY
jgi:hypothetical protein